MIKLNLGCGDNILKDWINIDAYNDKADEKFNVEKLPYLDNSVDIILASHIIEHFTFKKAFIVLKE